MWAAGTSVGSRVRRPLGPRLLNLLASLQTARGDGRRSVVSFPSLSDLMVGNTPSSQSHFFLKLVFCLKLVFLNPGCTLDHLRN